MNEIYEKPKPHPNTLLRHQRHAAHLTLQDVADKLYTMCVEEGRESGISADTVGRWERGISSPEAHYRAKLCRLFGMSAAALGLIAEEPGQRKESDIEDMHPGRREATKFITTVTGSTLLSPVGLLNQEIVDRLLRALSKPSNIDEVTLTHLFEITKQHWQMFATTGFPRHSLLSSLSGHLQTLTQLLEYSLPTHRHNYLCTLVSETAQIIGEILFDENDGNTAGFYYNIAVEAAKSAHSPVLQAVALGRKSFIPIYNKDKTVVQNALPLLQEAHRLTSQGAPEITRAWLSAVKAEALANNGDTSACFKALEQAEYFLERVKPDETGYVRPGESQYARFSKIVLLGYKGVCYTRLHQPAYAQKALHESISLVGNTRLRHKSIMLVDLAMTYLQQEEIEEACKYAEQALAIMAQTKSPRTFDRIFDLRYALEDWKTEATVKYLDEQIATIRPSVNH